MKIGELASRTGLAASRIRFYEASGLISAQRQANGYRRYPEQAVQTLGIISCAQQAGFSLDEIRRLLPQAWRTRSCWPACSARSVKSRPCSNGWRRTRRNCWASSPASKANPRACPAPRMPSG